MRKSTTNSRASRRRVALFALAALASLLIALIVSAASFAKNPTPTGGGHTPVTFCHKPGTPAQKSLTSDDDGFVQGHLGHGDTQGACSTEGEEPDDEVIDVCTNIEGNQPSGTVCYPDACPSIEGYQPAGTDCNPVVVVDACPDIAGDQAAGTVCTTPQTPQNPGSSNAGGGGTAEGPTGVDLSGAAVDNDHEPTLGNAAAPGQKADGPQVTVAGAVASPASPAAVAAGADPVVGSGGSLPYTGASTWIAAMAGIGAVLLGMLSYREARRVSRRRAVVGAAA